MIFLFKRADRIIPLDEQEELINEFVKGPSDSAVGEQESSHVIGPVVEKEFRLDSSPILNKDGLEMKDY